MATTMTTPVPADVPTEVALVGHMLTQSKSEDLDFTSLKPNHFYSPPCRLIWESICDLDREGQPFDAVSVAAKLRNSSKLDQIGGTAKLAEIGMGAAVLGEAALKSYALRIRNFWKAREFLAACQVGQSDVRSSGEEIDQIILRHDKTVSDLLLTDQSKGPVSFFDATQQTLKEIRDPSSEMSTTTGFGALDIATGGGTHAGDLVIVAGRPGMGKTAFVLNLCVNVAARGRNTNAVGMFSLEMPLVQLVTRILCTESGVQMSEVRSKGLTGESWSKLAKSADRLCQIPMWIDDQSALSVQELRARIRSIKCDIARKHGNTVKLKVVAVDYLQLMRGNTSPNREQEISSITRALKALAKEENLCIIALSQLNRDTEKTQSKRPALKDLRESGAIEQDADMVIFLYRAGYYDEEQDQNEAEAIIAKQRNGATKTVPLYWDPKRMRYSDPDHHHEYDEFDDVAEDWTP